jgi:hypothetical protein
MNTSHTDLVLHLTTSYSWDILSDNHIPAALTSDLVSELYHQPMRVQADAVRDALSEGQLASKILACDMLYNTGLDHDTALVVGGWYGTLSKLLLSKKQNLHITSLDIDPTVAPIADAYIRDPNRFTAVTVDMYDFQLYGDYGVVINTSCEHIPDLPMWLSMLQRGQTILLQSNNLFDCEGHVNCCNSIFDLVEQAHKHVDIISCNILYCAAYQRYTLLGQIK